MSKYFGTPFADSGDKTTIPDAAQAGGEISYAEGYTVDYSLSQVSNPSAKDVGRAEFNQLGNDLSGAIKDIQEQGILVYRADVNHSVNSRKVGSDGEEYKCLIVNGPLSTVVDPVGDLTGVWAPLISNAQASVSGTATFTNSTNNIALTGVGLLSDLEVGDVYTVTGTASNNKTFTVEVITDDDNVIVNQAHAGGTTSKSLVTETSSCTITLLAKWYNASEKLGQGVVELSGSRTLGVTETNTTGRTIFVSVTNANGTNSRGMTMTVDGIITDVAYSQDVGNHREAVSYPVPKESTYKVDAVTTAVIADWTELR